FAGQWSAYDKARQALMDPTLPAEDWQDLFKQHQVQQLALANFMTEDYQRKLLRWWIDPGQWRLRHGDPQTMLLSWAGPNQRWPFQAGADDLNRLAFGKVPDDQRPPPRGAKMPAPLSFWTLYLDGIPPTPPHVGESLLRQERFRL